ncbi:MAG: type II toxin-antitoxin system VapC family toxin [Gomphosphaeria aponina SAG 52.96 = DSM 107014]|uniref:Type II toxin-antitoxin system VapC family toxin n=1 Tax=Gomphosphaeria aponina SAG 52.96 = DSM 107014 TaxID=1521640 RepID=A0A941GMK2_9CHRO|nr:type II toxin-antitoxin system VapC family toxin [Gomphosphaeria aponina SAG 52.96 = DSM 107014]
MKILIDTHTFLWFAQGSSKLSPQATELLEDDENETLLSIASIWEMQIKIKIGKLQLDVPLPELIASQQTTNELEILPIKLSHIWALDELPLHHKDPFDRLLIAQGIRENLPILSIDSSFDQYPGQRLW